MAPRETENDASAKFWGYKQRTLWCVMVFSGVVNWVSSVRTLHKPTFLEGFFAAAKVALLTAMILFAFKTLLILIISEFTMFYV